MTTEQQFFLAVCSIIFLMYKLLKICKKEDKIEQLEKQIQHLDNQIFCLNHQNSLTQQEERDLIHLYKEKDKLLNQIKSL